MSINKRGRKTKVPNDLLDAQILAHKEQILSADGKGELNITVYRTIKLKKSIIILLPK